MWVEKNGPTYRIRDLVDGRKTTIEKGWPTKSAAKARMIALTADKMRGDFIDPRAGRTTLATWIDAWWPTYEVSLKPTVKLSEGSRVRMHILPLLGHLALDDLDTLTIQRWLAQLLGGVPEPGKPGRWRRRPLAPKTVRNVHGTLHRILGGAVAARQIRINPCTGVKLPKVPHKEMRFLTEPEIGRLVAAVPVRWRPLILLLVTTGLRWGEATGLRVQDVDVLAGRLTVLRAMHELATTGEIVFTEPKTEHGRRTVVFPKSVALSLSPLVSGKRREELVFTAPLGGPVRTRNFRRGWVKWTAAAGLAGLRIHDLRHTLAASLISAGVALTAVQRMLGHSSIAVTSDLYGHLLPAVDAGILAAVEAAIAGVRPEDLDAEVAGEVADELADAA
ncbi:tyrosine-type recombinase/integrase [Micromonospora chersina]|uniref:tyrosine-type recombinase/integrase n=1 Tax=Micromonospora chersina TaxID=47854 RepID=UPI0037A76011